MTIKGQKIGFVGAGNMGEAMIKGLLTANLVPPEAVYATDVRLERLKEIDRQYGIRIAADNPELVRHVDVVIMAVKPQIIEPVLKEIAHSLTRQKLLISIAAGVTTAKLRTVLGKEARLIRVMPNTPALVLAGVTAIATAEGLEPGDLDTAREIFSAVGRVVVLEEGLLDAVTGLSGSGPAYVALDRVARRRRGEDGARPDHGDDARDPDGARRRQAPARDGPPPWRAEGHGQLARGDLHRGHRGAGGGRDPHDVQHGGRARHAAFPRARDAKMRACSSWATSSTRWPTSSSWCSTRTSSS